MAWVANQTKASKVLGVENLPNQRFSLQGEDNNESNLWEEASWDGEDYKVRISKAASTDFGFVKDSDLASSPL